MENEVKKVDASCWNGQMCLDNSEWLAENIKGMDQSVKEMLQLIGNDGHSPMEKVDDNHPKQPELIACIKEISQRHHWLADHYNKLTGDLSCHSNSINKSNEKRICDPHLTPPFLTPMNKLRMHDVDGQVIGSDVSLSSGGGISDVTPNGGSESSLSSDSDSDCYYASPNEHLSSLTSGRIMKSRMDEHTYQMLLRRVSDYEEETNIYKEKLLFAEEEIVKLKSEIRNNETAMVKFGSIEAELLSAKNQIKLHEAEIEKENDGSLMLHRKIVGLEDELELEKTQVRELQESVKKCTLELPDRDIRIQELKSELQDASGNFAMEKWQLESAVSKLAEHLSFHEARIKELRMQCELLADENKKCQAEKSEMQKWQEALRITQQDDIELVKIELFKKNALLDTLNENVDGLKLKYDVLVAERDGVIAKLQTLDADIRHRDDQIQHLKDSLNELHSENKRLSAGSDRANKLTGELRSRIGELEKEVAGQAIMISDMAERKREAIRQLCFSIDYFRCKNDELRNAYAARKGPMAVV
ncbi:hypothetical protein OROGR_025723 [Orobanche gracilis]